MTPLPPGAAQREADARREALRKMAEEAASVTREDGQRITRAVPAWPVDPPMCPSIRRCF